MVNASTGLFDVKGAVPAAQGLATGTTVKLSVISDQAVNVMTAPGGHHLLRGRRRLRVYI